MKISSIFAAAIMAVSVSTAFADTGTISTGYQPGLTYLPIMLMDANHTFEKHAAALNIKEPKASYVRTGGPGQVIDGLLSDSFQCGSVGSSSVPLLFVKSKGNFKMVSNLSYMPMFLNSTNPAIKTVADYKNTTNNWVGVPTQGTSVQAIVFQKAVANTFGVANAKSLDHLTHTIPHPDAMAQLLSGKAEVNNHLTAPPFQYQELEDGKGRVHKVMSSYDVFGKSSFVTAMCSVKFEKANPLTIKAYTEAVYEEINWINTHKAEAAKRYVELSGTKESKESVLKMLNDPDIEFNVVPQGIEKYSTFMNSIGSLTVDHSVLPKAPTAKEMSFGNLQSTNAN